MVVTAVLKLYFIGTALSVLAVLYGIVDSFGGLMYPQECHYDLDMVHQTQTQTQRQIYESNTRRRAPATVNIRS